MAIDKTNIYNIIINGKTYAAQYDTTISSIFKMYAIDFDMPCSGTGKCGKCKITVNGNTNDITPTEKDFLTAEEINQGIRLACYTKVRGDLTVEVVNTFMSNIATKSINKVHIKNKLFNNYGIAIDIGTTTVAAQLYGKYGLIATKAVKNPQTILGADVISRIQSSLSGNNNQLQELIITCINNIIDELSSQETIDDIDYLVITGNTTMLYLLTNKNPYSLSRVPFEADCLFNCTIDSDSIGVKLNNHANIYLPSCISAFVGADITTAILSSEILNQKTSDILVDIGTNGEMVLWHNNTLTCTSTAAGPAFEGSEIACGCLGISGAIDRVFTKDGEIKVTTINNTSPIGICGSGIIDAIAVMKSLSLIDENGAFIKEELECRNLLTIKNDIVSCKITDNIFITQQDIRRVQLAKSAIYAGLKTLMYTQNIDYNQIDTLYIAGGFGNYMNIDSACYIGLIPLELHDKVKVIGNAALNGAAEMLCDKSKIDFINSKISYANCINLSTEKMFMDFYVDGMQI